MQLYTGTDIARGAGIFDYVMATEVEAPKRLTAMRRRDAIGIIAAAFASPLDTEQVEALIDQFFDTDDHDLLCKTFHMYNGNDKRLHLWNREASGAERLCWNLRYCSRPEWKLPFESVGKLAL